MEELIFFAVIIFFSILESVARSRRAKQGGAGTGAPGEVRAPDEAGNGWEFEWARTDDDDELPTYDEEPSYDQGPSYDQRPSYDDRALEGGATRPGRPSAPPRPSSETMLPKDLFEELAGLAGRLEQERESSRTLDLPKQSPPLPMPPPSRVPAPPPARAPAAAPARTPARSTEGHRIHLSHAGYGTDPSSRAPSEQDGLDPLAVFLSEDARAVRRQLLGGSGAALRQAIILREVLGPPLALRSEDEAD